MPIGTLLAFSPYTSTVRSSESAKVEPNRQRGPMQRADQDNESYIITAVPEGPYVEPSSYVPQVFYNFHLIFSHPNE